MVLFFLGINLFLSYEVFMQKSDLTKEEDEEEDEEKD